MNDWDIFVEFIPWFVDAGVSVHVSEPQHGLPLPSSVAVIFPALAQLLAQSIVTPVRVKDVPYQLLTWNTDAGQRMGWLCLTPDTNVPGNIHPAHASLLQSFGGIIERFNEPNDTWLLNHNDAWTGREASHDASFINHYAWAFAGAGVDLPIRPSEFYCLAREANGNTTICHRTTGQVLLFAPDHAFDYVMPFDGCPEYTLYRLNGVGTLCDWVETVARQWLGHVRRSK